MHRYDEYKDSGVEWLGEVPEHWAVKRLKDLAVIMGGKDFKDVISNKGYPVYGSGGPFETAYTYMYDKPSVLLGRKGTVDKPLYVTEPFWTVDTMYYTVINKSTYKKYFYYRCLTIPFGFFQYGSAVPSMTQGDLNHIFFGVPGSFEEQKAIAEYLDEKTAAIDKKVSLLEQKAGKYRQLKQSLINETVTGGIIDNGQWTIDNEKRSTNNHQLSTKMKESGIDWIGKIPEHWEVKRGKDFICLRKGKNPLMFTDDKRDLPYLSMEYLRGKLLEPLYVRKQSNLISVDENEILILWDGANAGEVILSKKGYISSTMAIVQISKGVLHEFCYYLLKSFEKKFKDDANGTTIPHFDSGSLLLREIILPPLEEQQIIADYLDDKTAAMDKIVASIGNQIEKLKEFRKTLINDVVTGKIKVVE